MRFSFSGEGDPSARVAPKLGNIVLAEDEVVKARALLKRFPRCLPLSRHNNAPSQSRPHLAGELARRSR
jgi:hypothetical protein